MSTTINLIHSFEVELEDNTIINVMVSLEAMTGDGNDEDEDFQANQRIRSFTYDNVIEPLEEALTELFTAEDMADSIGTVGFAASGDMLTADDYPECA